MEYRCAKKALIKTLTDVSKATAKCTMPILEGVCIEAGVDSVTLTCYNMEFGLTATIPAVVEQSGKTVVSVKSLLKLIKKMTGDTLTIVERTKEIPSFEAGKAPYIQRLIDLSDGYAHFTVCGMDVEEFPLMPDLGDITGFSIPQRTLKLMLDQTLYAVAKTDAKPINTGILFDLADGLLNLVSVDGYRLALSREKVESDIQTSFVVPDLCVCSLAKLLNAKCEANAKILSDGKYATAEFDNYRAFTRLLNGDFMDYKRAIPKPSGKYAILSAKDLANALNRAILMTGSSHNNKNPLRMVFGPSKISLAINTQSGEYFEEVDCNSKGIDQDTEMGFNPKYLVDAFKVLNCDLLRIELDKVQSPIRLIPVDDNGEFVHLVLPLRLNNKQAA